LALKKRKEWKGKWKFYQKNNENKGQFSSLPQNSVHSQIPFESPVWVLLLLEDVEDSVEMLYT